MMTTVSIFDEHLEMLKTLIFENKGNRRPAILFCSRSSIPDDIWGYGKESRFLSKEIAKIDCPEDKLDGLSWNVGLELLQEARKNNFVLAFVYGKDETESCSNQCYLFEKNNYKELFSSNNEIDQILSIYASRDGEITGKLWTPIYPALEIDFFRIIGKRFRFHYPGKYQKLPREEFDRQQLVFGHTLNNDLSRLKIGIIGCGATGSATAHLLTRLGVGHLLLIDNDLVEKTNLNRLYGATIKDIGKPKVLVLKDYLENIGLGTRIFAIQAWVSDPKSRDALKSCDIVFGCTDDNNGRVILNRLAHFYYIPVIDMGVTIDPSMTEQGSLQTLQGRVTMVIPRSTCLICRHVIDIDKARDESMMRIDPERYEKLDNEDGYVKKVNVPSPAVITFTTEVATIAVNEFVNRLTGFKQGRYENSIMRFFDKSVDQKPGAAPQIHCPICSKSDLWGLGDVEPFLDLVL